MEFSHMREHWHRAAKRASKEGCGLGRLKGPKRYANGGKMGDDTGI
jgi:hypothetical protein